MFIIVLFGIKQLNKIWKKIHQLSCFVGHPVGPCLCPTTENKRFLSPPLMDKREGVRGMFRGTGGKEGMLHSIELNLTYQI